MSADGRDHSHRVAAGSGRPRRRRPGRPLRRGDRDGPGGRPDVSIIEARDRCRAAITNSNLTWPNTRRITILLSPADLPKSGPHFDLGIAVAVLAASDQKFPRDSLTRAAMIGELTLDGRVRCVPGVLPMVMAAAARGIETVYVPEPQTGEASMVPGHGGLRDPVARPGDRAARGRGGPEAPEVAADVRARPSVVAWRGAPRGPRHGRRHGMADARYAIEVAAAGGHHLMLTGPEGFRQDHPGRTDPRPAARPRRRRVPGADGGPLPVRRAAAGRLPADAAALPGAAPLRVAHGHPRRRQRPGAARAR